MRVAPDNRAAQHQVAPPPAMPQAVNFYAMLHDRIGSPESAGADRVSPGIPQRKKRPIDDEEPVVPVAELRERSGECDVGVEQLLIVIGEAIDGPVQILAMGQGDRFAEA